MSSFKEINQLTDCKATSFTFGLEDSQNILFPRDETNALQPEDIEFSMKGYKYLMEKEIRYNLHGSTLSEYWRASRIPRGLRIQKAPTIGREDPAFCNRWCEIMNKASLDLTLLVIEFTQKELLKTKQDIDEIQTSIIDSHDETVFKQHTELLEKSLAKFKQDLQQIKIKKFRRDTMDYRDNQVYTWLNQTKTTRPLRKVHFEDGASLTPASSVENDFLGGQSSDTDSLQSATRPRLRRCTEVDEAVRPDSKSTSMVRKQSRKKTT